MIELKKLLTTKPAEVVEKIAGNSLKVAESLLMPVSSLTTSLGSNKTKPDKRACMHGSRLFRYVRINYPYKRRIQPKLYESNKKV